MDEEEEGKGEMVQGEREIRARRRHQQHHLRLLVVGELSLSPAARRGKVGKGGRKGKRRVGGILGIWHRASSDIPRICPFRFLFLVFLLISFLVAGNVPSFWVTCRQRMSCAVIELRSTSY